MTLLVATTNPGKIREILPLLAGTRARVVTLADLPPMAEPEETGATFWENARLKALAYSRASGLLTVAEDSGLTIDALGGAPGVRSARFVRPDATYPERFDEIFRRLRDIPGAPHTARFVTALAVADGTSLVFESETWMEGVLAPAAAGGHGFGYDPIFLYPPFGKTTGELTIGEKAAVSHRARAFRDLRRALFAA